jgi:RNA polymerase sigma-70 factor (ECF subfamily)
MNKNFELDAVLNQLANGDQFAIEELYNYYYPRLYNFSKSILKIEDGIDDILQEVFIKIWINRAKITKADSFNSFIYTISKNLLLNELRRKLNMQKFRDKIAKLAIAKEYSLIELAEYTELKERIELAINELPDRQKEIFILSRLNGFSHKEIAAQLAIRTKTVEYHISKASNYIKYKLKNLDLVS